jgi:hypothetical protein
MRTFFLITSLICLSFILSGCTIRKPFVIRNESDKEIIVEYTMKASDSNGYVNVIKPLMMPVAKRKSWFNNNDWEQMPEECFTFDYKERKGTIRIKSQEAVSIYEVEYSSNIKELKKDFDLIDLKIKDNGKEIYFENSERLFEEFIKNDFEIIYK